MPIWYNPFGARAAIFGNQLIAGGGVYVFAFNGMAHLSRDNDPGLANFQAWDGAIWRTIFALGPGLDVEANVVIVAGATRLQDVGGPGTVRWSGWRFTG